MENFTATFIKFCAARTFKVCSGFFLYIWKFQNGSFVTKSQLTWWMINGQWNWRWKKVEVETRRGCKHLNLLNFTMIKFRFLVVFSAQKPMLKSSFSWNVWSFSSKCSFMLNGFTKCSKICQETFCTKHKKSLKEKK